MFDQLRALPGWHVSEGLARHRKRERQVQKEVDILIAVDMLTHTHRKNMHRLTFVSGDQDFAPLLEAVVRDGMYVELLYPEGHTSQDLMHFADVARPMDIDFMYSVSTEAFRRRHELPIRSADLFGIQSVGIPIGEGLHAGAAVARVLRNTTSGTVYVRAAYGNANGEFFTVRSKNEALAKRYFATCMQRDFGIPAGSLVWESIG